MITEKIKTMQRLRYRSIAVSNEELENARPEKNDLAEIPVLYKKFTEVCNPHYKDNNGIFVAIIVFLYCPISFINSNISRRGVRSSIAKVLGLSKYSISVYFGKAKSLILNHHGFRSEAERVYSLMMSD